MPDSTNPWVTKDGQEVKFAYFGNVTVAYYISGVGKDTIHVNFSVSQCHEGKDVYDKRLGRKIAFGRLDKGGFTKNGYVRCFGIEVQKKEDRLDQSQEILHILKGLVEGTIDFDTEAV